MAAFLVSIHKYYEPVHSCFRPIDFIKIFSLLGLAKCGSLNRAIFDYRAII